MFLENIEDNDEIDKIQYFDLKPVEIQQNISKENDHTLCSYLQVCAVLFSFWGSKVVLWLWMSVRSESWVIIRILEAYVTGLVRAMTHVGTCWFQIEVKLTKAVNNWLLAQRQFSSFKKRNISHIKCIYLTLNHPNSQYFFPASTLEGLSTTFDHVCFVRSLLYHTVSGPQRPIVLNN